jgi:hypothetical protein
MTTLSTLLGHTTGLATAFLNPATDAKIAAHVAQEIHPTPLVQIIANKPDGFGKIAHATDTVHPYKGLFCWTNSTKKLTEYNFIHSADLTTKESKQAKAQAAHRENAFLDNGWFQQSVGIATKKAKTFVGENNLGTVGEVVCYTNKEPITSAEGFDYTFTKRPSYLGKLGSYEPKTNKFSIN